MMERGVALIALLLGGCALTRGPDEPVMLHLPAPLAPIPDARRAGSIALSSIGTEGVAGQLRYAYVLPDGSMRQAATLFWEQPPAHSLEQALLAALSQRFAIVRIAGEAGAADRRMSVTLTRFHEIAGADARALVALSVREPGGNVQICAASPIAGPTPGDRAAAFDRALTQAATATARYAVDRAPPVSGC